MPRAETRPEAKPSKSPAPVVTGERARPSPGPRPGVLATTPQQVATTQAAPTGEPSADQIRVRAYEIYLARGAQPGRDKEDWEQARRELSAGRAQATLATGPRRA